MQANILASYKPLVNLTLVIPDLKSIEDSMIDAQQSFSRIRNIVVYYEDLLQNKEVSHLHKYFIKSFKGYMNKEVFLGTLDPSLCVV